jgi:hypothetical protein
MAVMDGIYGDNAALPIASVMKYYPQELTAACGVYIP